MEEKHRTAEDGHHEPENHQGDSDRVLAREIKAIREQLHANREQPTPHEKNQHTLAVAMFVATAIYAVVTLGIFIASKHAADAAKKSADAASASAAAWMVVEGVVGQLQRWSEDERRSVDQGNWCPDTNAMAAASAHVVNAGATPAGGWENTWETIFVAGSSEDVRPTFHGCPSTRRTQPGVATKNEYRDVLMWHCLSPLEAEQMLAKDGRVYFHLCVTYNDVFGLPHTTEHAFLFPMWDTHPDKGIGANWARYCSVR